MTPLSFTCTGVRADPYAAGPTLVFRLRITAGDQARVHALALRCQLRLEPARRGYGTEEGERLTDLFGINQPQVAILAVGTIEKRVVVVDDMIAMRQRGYLTLGYDHRLVDGAVADEFMSKVKAAIESWD